MIDSAGRCVCLGVVPGIFSLTLSLLSLLKGSIDVSEGKTWRDTDDCGNLGWSMANNILDMNSMSWTELENKDLKRTNTDISFTSHDSFFLIPNITCRTSPGAVGNIKNQCGLEGGR